MVEASVPKVFQQALELTQESSFEATGLIRADSRAPGGFEMVVSSIAVIHKAKEFPISRKAHGIDFLMSHRHLWLRSRRQTTILKIRHTFIQTIRDFFNVRGFTLVDTPILIKNAAEGAGTLFPVDFFGEPAYLTQTGQLHLECACMALGKVYCFGPTFRAEKSKTRRHLCEFWMVEPEVAFADLNDIIQLAEDMVCHIVKTLLTQHMDDLVFLERDIEPLKKVTEPFPRITYTEAVDLLRSPDVAARLEHDMEADQQQLQGWINELNSLESKQKTVGKAWKQERINDQLRSLRDNIRDLEGDLGLRRAHIEQARSFAWGKDFGGNDETILSSHFEKPVFITDYPKSVKAFYMKHSASNHNVVKNVDLLAAEGYGEIIGGSQREENIDMLLDRMRDENMNPEDYEWYLDLRRYGSVPHSGFGLGIERMLAWICGLKHVRETIPFPRLMGRMVP